MTPRPGHSLSTASRGRLVRRDDRVVFCTPPVFSESVARVLDQCLTTVPLIIVMPLLVDFLSGAFLQSESTWMSVCASSSSFHVLIIADHFLNAFHIPACFLHLIQLLHVGYVIFVHVSLGTRRKSDLSRLMWCTPIFFPILFSPFSGAFLRPLLVRFPLV